MTSLFRSVGICLVVALTATVSFAQLKVGSDSTSGAATYQLDPNAEIQAELHLATSNPSTFGGANVAPIIGADRFYNAGITGQNTITANIEAGHVWSGHDTLGHVTQFVNDSSAPAGGWATPAYDRHATWVGMMIGGRGTQTYQTGVAPNTDLRSGAIATSWSGSAYALSFSIGGNSFLTPYSSGVTGFGAADVINSSWGFTDPDGDNLYSILPDGLANQNPLTTYVVSAGNNGPGTNTVGSPGAAYNAITVGALQNSGNNYDTIASFSSRGPNDWVDGSGNVVSGVRAAVDISAPGTTLTSAYYGGQSGGNDPNLAGSSASGSSSSYSGGLGGTSFSSPITAGGAALMVSASRADTLGAESRDARVIKANMLNAARKTTGWDNGQFDDNGVIVTNQSLDWTFGAGALDLDRTYDQYLQGETDIAGTTGGTTDQTIGWDYGEVSLNAGSNDVIINQVLAGGTEFRATLAWFRERTASGFTVSDVGEADLDLQIWDSTFTTLYATSQSFYNNVEHLTFNLPETGTYGIRVNYFGNMFGNLTSEEYGLAWWAEAAEIPVPASGGAVLVLTCLTVFRRRRRA